MARKSYTLAPNRLIANFLEQEFYAKELAACPKNTLRAANILTLDQWLSACWKNLRHTSVLLEPYQEFFIWQKIFQKNSPFNQQIEVSAAIHLHKIIHEYELDLHEISQLAPPEFFHVLPLYEEFQRYCKQHRLVTFGEIPRLLTQQQIELLGPFKLTLVAFHEYTPAITSLFTRITRAGGEVLELNSQVNHPATSGSLACDNLEEELSLAARWSKQQLSRESSCKIGIIVPHLSAIANQVHHTFAEVFNYDFTKFRIEVRRPLSELPITQTALKIIAYQMVASSVKKTASLIISPYLAGAQSEKKARTFLYLNQQFADEPLQLNELTPPLLHTMLMQLQETCADQLHSSQVPSAWSQLFRRLLTIVGWPGETKLTEQELQAAHHCVQAIQKLSKNDLLFGPISYAQAVHLLELNLQSIFLTPVPPQQESPIVVLNMAEGAGIQFDSLWITGLDAESWPPNSTRPNPWLPLHLQKTLGVPHASREKELHYATQLITRYRQSARRIIFSYVRYQDEHEVPAHELILSDPPLKLQDVLTTNSTTTMERIFESQQLEVVQDTHVTAVAERPPRTLSSRTIERQSLCPFLACAEFHLGITDTANPIALGMPPAERGKILHQTLEHLWQHLRNRQNLSSLTKEQLSTLIQQALKRATQSSEIAPKVLAIELIQMQEWLLAWMCFETTREDFELCALEKNYELQLGAAKIKIRIDRIDKLASGRKMVIDYKTGGNLPTFTDWFSPNPRYPQLLLYSLAVAELDRLAIVQINRAGIKLREITLADLQALIAKNQPETLSTPLWNWQQIKAAWSKTLEALATEFLTGTAYRRPLSPDLCTTCKLSALCRVNSPRLKL